MCSYPIYNKPWVLSQWFKIAKPTEDYFLVLDSDMTIHRPFLPEQFQVAPGTMPPKIASALGQPMTLLDHPVHISRTAALRQQCSFIGDGKAGVSLGISAGLYSL